MHVDTDQNIFDGVPENLYPKIAQNYINKQFKGRLSGMKILPTFRGKVQYAYPANRRMKQDVKTTKMRASTELDHFLDAARLIEHIEDDGRHPDVIGGWDHYKVLFGMNEKYFEGIVNIKNGNEGRVFYDLTKIKDVTSRKYGGLVRASTRSVSGSNTSTQTIPDNRDNDQAKNSERETENGNYSLKTAKYSKYGIGWRHAYDRWAGSSSPMSRAGYAMFAESSTHDRVVGRGSKFGNTLYIYYGKDAVHVDDIRKNIIKAWNEDVETDDIPSGMQTAIMDGITAEDIADSFNPVDIVESADSFDDEEMTSWLYNRVLEPSGIEAVITNDGAIVFNKDLIERTDGVTQDEAADDVLNYAEQLKAKEGIRYSERDTSLLSKREILAGAFDNVAKTDGERSMLQGHKRIIHSLNRLETRAVDLRNANKQERAKGAEADRELIKSRTQEIQEIEDRIAEADKKLLRMQNAAPLRNLFKRESARLSAQARLREKGYEIDIDMLEAMVKEMNFEDPLKSPEQW